MDEKPFRRAFAADRCGAAALRLLVGAASRPAPRGTRADRNEHTEVCASPDNCRQPVLDWLEDNHIPLADAAQHDVNTWAGEGASTRHRLRGLLRWAHGRGLAVDLEVRWLGSEGLPEQIHDEHWALLSRCLRDDSLSRRLRVAGALVLLYGQIPSRIVELTTDSITTSGAATYLALRDHPVLLPPPLATLITQLVAHNSRWQATTSGAETPIWLFPGARIGSHLEQGRLTLLLNNEIGVSVRPARGAALCGLACDLPARVLAELLGLSISAATGWVAVTARDEAHYLEARIAKSTQRCDRLKPIHA
jgi:hypothetical protein